MSKPFTSDSSSLPPPLLPPSREVLGLLGTCTALQVVHVLPEVPKGLARGIFNLSQRLEEHGLVGEMQRPSSG